jgi:hypothetical protein
VVAVAILVWAVATIPGCLVFLCAENLVAIRERVSYLYGFTPRKWPDGELAISCLFSVIISEFFGIFCLVYAISGGISFKYIA